MNKVDVISERLSRQPVENMILMALPGTLNTH
jgi:hypothetical protein